MTTQCMHATVDTDMKQEGTDVIFGSKNVTPKMTKRTRERRAWCFKGKSALMKKKY